MYKELKVVHVVKNFGPVGGMERYVWELVHELAKAKINITVLCETQHAQPETNIKVIEIGKTFKKPTWLSMLFFSKKVKSYITNHPAAFAQTIIHSHMRISIHHVTTFHSSVFKCRKRRLFDFLSPRIHAWLYLEKMELCGSKVQAVLPNSSYIAEMLKKNYPCCVDKIGFTAFPGVAEHFYTIPREADGKTVGFIGREWKRKGLEMVCDIIKPMLAELPELKLLVAGPAKEEIEHLFSDWPAKSYRLLGWKKTEEVIGQVDVLIHPAKSEPFGMVVAEANAAGVPCLISTHCGIGELLTTEMGRTLPLSNKQQWRDELKILLQHQQDIKQIQHLSWAALAKKHISLYSSIVAKIV